MTALSKDLARRQKAAPAARTGRRGVAADAVIYLGSGVAKNAAGWLVAMSDAAAVEIVGVSEEHVDNTGGANGAIKCSYKTGAEFEFDNDGSIGQADLGRACYAKDDNTVGDAGSAVNDMFVGVVQEFTATKVFVLVDEVLRVTESLDGPFDGGDVANVADAQVLGGVPVLYIITVGDTADGDTDVIVTDKVEVVEVWCQKTNGAGAGNTMTVKNAGNAISDAMACAVDNAITRAASLDDARTVINAGGTLRVSNHKAAGTGNGRVFVLCVKRA